MHSARDVQETVTEPLWLLRSEFVVLLLFATDVRVRDVQWFTSIELCGADGHSCLSPRCSKLNY
jgi:hypothetical protein